MLRDNPKVSIILPAFNAGEYIHNSIECILNQTYTNWELLVCDDCSKDNTYHIIEYYRQCDHRIKLFRNEMNLGSLRTRNKLFDIADGELIALQDADDTSALTRFERQIDQFVQMKKLMLCGTWANYYFRNKIVRIKKGATETDQIRKEMPRQNQFCSASIMFRKSLLNEVGGYRDYFSDKGNYDYDFTYRIAEKYHSIIIPEPLYNVNILPRSNSKDPLGGSDLKYVSDQIVRALANQRKISHGLDDLMLSKSRDMISMEKQLLLPFKENPYLKYDVHVNTLLRYGMSREAVKFSFFLVLRHPFDIRPFKLFLYTLKHAF